MTIIVATNLGGRGTDLKLSKEVLEHGGLHVILSYLPSSIRIEDQAFGRVARKGEAGSAQVIANLETGDDIAVLRNKRDSQELIAMDIAMHCKVPEMLMEDELFDKYLDLIRKLTSPTGKEIVVGYMQPKKLNLADDQIGIYLKDDHIYLKYIKNSFQAEPL
ncbi:hypothetical protein NOVO_01800 [Rickettsiales bacterium Ac37b]|nr:hypothetical protein NOVO_01800 [Rickettsiales bacterium Ac37b]